MADDDPASSSSLLEDRLGDPGRLERTDRVGDSEPKTGEAGRRRGDDGASVKPSALGRAGEPFAGVGGWVVKTGIERTE